MKFKLPLAGLLTPIIFDGDYHIIWFPLLQGNFFLASNEPSARTRMFWDKG